MKKKIYDLSLDGCVTNSSIILTNTRHVEILKEAKILIEATLKTIMDNSLDLVSLDIRQMYEKLGEITGETTNEKVIDKIFSKFCLGK